MSIDLIKFAFVAGEISPNYFGRPDLEKFDLGLAEGENWFVDYRGGVSTRPGTEFLDYLMDDDKPIKLYSFKFSSDLANTYLLVLGHFWIRFVQDGAYVLEASKNITGLTNANPAVVTANAHGFNNGDWVKIAAVNGPNNVNGETFVVSNKTANTFELKDAFGNNFSTIDAGVYVNGGTVARIYTVVSPWDSAHLEDLKCHQVRDLLRFTHKNYKIRNLTRQAANSWTLAIEDLAPAIDPPTVFDDHVSTSGTQAVLIQVTAVDSVGRESLPSDTWIVHSISSADVKYTVTWTPVVGAVYYNVYQSRVEQDSSITLSIPVGFISRATGGFLSINNIIPDFTRTPPKENNPFADGRIERIDVTNSGGSNYNNNSTITLTGGGGSGFVGNLVIALPGAASGPVVGVNVKEHGSGYSSDPTVVHGSPGSGATFSVIRSPISGNNPACGAIFQQRQVYAATENDPLSIIGSRPQRLSDFSFTDITAANDSYEHVIDSDSVDPIRHLIPTRGGLIVINEAGIWLLSGSQGAAVTPTNAQADPQAYKGATSLVPLKIDTDLLYQEGQGGAIRLLSYNDINKVYGGTDMSVLANHLFGIGKRIKAWAYSDEPFKLVWAQREDGIGLSFTLLKEQSVYAWMRQTTKGLFQDMIAVQENQRSSVYTIVKRYVNGRWTKFLERFAVRVFDHVENSWNVDCGLELTQTYPASDIQVAAATGTNILVTATAAIFSGGDVGKILRANGGKMVVTTFNTNTTIHVNIIRDLTELVPQTSPALPQPANSGEWTLDTPVTVIRGLRHLEGQTVQILADGNVSATKVVANGSITLDAAATRVIIGLGYRCLLKTLPLTISGAVIEEKRKRIVGIASRLHETRGLQMGMELAHLYPMKERTNEPLGEPTRLQEGIYMTLIEPTWDDNGQFYFVEDDPLPATLLGFVVNTETGDDDDTGTKN